LISFDTWNAEVALHKDILCPRQTIPHLVGWEWITLERALRIEPHDIHPPNLILCHSIPNAQYRFVTFLVLESDAHQVFSGCDEKKKCG